MTTPVDVRSLAQFKRFLAEPGATVQIVRHDLLNSPYTTPEKRAAMLAPRTVAKLQTNAVQFSNGSWLHFPKASTMAFEGDTVTVDLDDTSAFTRVIVYRLSHTEVIHAAS